MAKSAITILKIWTIENPPRAVSRKECEQFKAAHRHLDDDIRIIDLIGGTCSVTTTPSRDFAIEAIRGRGNVVINA